MLRVIFVPLFFLLIGPAIFAEADQLNISEDSSLITEFEDDQTELPIPLVAYPSVEPEIKPEVPQPTREVATKPVKIKSPKFIGSKTVNTSCMMRLEPSESSGEAGRTKKGLKIWVESEGTKWFKVYRKAGAAFVPSDCLD